MGPFLPPRNLFSLIFLCFLYFTGSCDAELRFEEVSCNGNRTYSQNSTYQTNLQTLFSGLVNQSSSTGFFNATAGLGPDKTHGLFLCKGDVSSQTCQDCVVNATRRLVDEFCNNQTEAIIWYDECMVRYSDRWIFSVLEESPGSFRTMVTIPTSAEGEVFQHEELSKTLGNLVNSTCSVGSKNKTRYYQNVMERYNYTYVLERYNYTSEISYTVLFQAQSTPDLTQEDCRKCLRSLTDDILSCCNSKLSYKRFLPSCRLDYAISTGTNEKSGSRALPGQWEVIQRIVVPTVTLVLLRLWNMP